MKRPRKLALLAITFAAITSIAVVLFSKTSELIKPKATSNDYTIVFNNSNGALTNSEYSSTTSSVTAHTTPGNPIVMRYKYGKKTEVDSNGRGYDASTGLCSLQYYHAHEGKDAYYYNYTAISNMQSIRFTFISGGAYGLALYMSTTTTFSKSVNYCYYGDSYGTNESDLAISTLGSEHTFTVSAVGYSHFYFEAPSHSSTYLKEIVVTYVCENGQVAPEPEANLAITENNALWNNASTSNSDRKVLNSIPYLHGGLAKSTSGVNKIYGQGYLYNQYPIYGIEKITINFSGTGNLRLTFGYALGNYDLYAVESVSNGEEIVFTDLTGYPNFFYLENTSGSKSYATSDNTGAYSVTTTSGVTTYSSSDRTIYHFEQSYHSSFACDISGIYITYKNVNQATSAQMHHRLIKLLTGLNIRSNPGTTGSTVLATESTGYMLAYRETVLDGNGDPWYRTYYMNQDCYVSGNASYTEIKTLADFGSNDENSIVVECEKHIGNRYLLGAQRYCWSATGAKDSNFDPCYYDCSSLMLRAFRDGAGLYPGANTKSQIQYGSKVASSSNLRLGNLVMLVSGSEETIEANVGHVTLWLGNDTLNTTNGDIMIQASGSNFTGKVNMYTNWATYWYSHFIEGRMIA